MLPDSASSGRRLASDDGSVERGARRIVVLGSPGSGKTTLSRRLAVALSLPHVNLDDLYWQPGWRRPPEPAFLASLDAAAAGNAWIIDGNYSRCLASRLARADTVVLLDLAPWRCALRALLRGMRRAFGERASLPCAVAAQAGARRPALPDWRFCRLILGFRRDTLPGMLAEIAATPDLRLVVLRGTTEGAAFLAATGAVQ
ncbi:hypothetical protein [Paraburkholderia sp. Clong3]|uniref:hypothetical protein n=1 Tax=Paraburkholderia sp. Clong3 TaxID=2991061 RepID=UPI003D1CC94B